MSLANTSLANTRMLPWLYVFIHRDLLYGSESTQCLHSRCCLSIYMKYTPYLSFTWRHMQMETYLQMMLGPEQARQVVINSGSGGLYAHQGWDVPFLRAHICEADIPRLRHCQQPRATAAAAQCCSWPSQVAEIPQPHSPCALCASGLIVPLHRAEQNSWRGLYFLDWPQ